MGAARYRARARARARARGPWQVPLTGDSTSYQLHPCVPAHAPLLRARAAREPPKAMAPGALLRPLAWRCGRAAAPRWPCRDAAPQYRRDTPPTTAAARSRGGPSRGPGLPSANAPAPTPGREPQTAASSKGEPPTLIERSMKSMKRLNFMKSKDKDKQGDTPPVEAKDLRKSYTNKSDKGFAAHKGFAALSKPDLQPFRDNGAPPNARASERSRSDHLGRSVTGEQSSTGGKEHSGQSGGAAHQTRDSPRGVISASGVGARASLAGQGGMLARRATEQGPQGPARTLTGIDQTGASSTHGTPQAVNSSLKGSKTGDRRGSSNAGVTWGQATDLAMEGGAVPEAGRLSERSSKKGRVRLTSQSAHMLGDPPAGAGSKRGGGADTESGAQAPTRSSEGSGRQELRDFERDEYLKDLLPFMPEPFFDRLADETQAAVEAGTDLHFGPGLETTVGAIMVADVTGFTQLTEKLTLSGGTGGEKLVNALNDYFQRAMVIIQAYGGHVVKFAGDAMVCTFTPTRDDWERVSELGGSGSEGPGDSRPRRKSTASRGARSAREGETEGDVEERLLTKCSIRATYCAEEIARKLGTVAMLPAGKVAVRREGAPVLSRLWQTSIAPGTRDDSNQSVPSAIQSASQQWPAIDEEARECHKIDVSRNTNINVSDMKQMRDAMLADLKTASTGLRGGATGSSQDPSRGVPSMLKSTQAASVPKFVEMSASSKNSRLVRNSRLSTDPMLGKKSDSGPRPLSNLSEGLEGTSSRLERLRARGENSAQLSITAASGLAPVNEEGEARPPGDSMQLQMKMMVGCGSMSFVHVRAAEKGGERWEGFVSDAPGASDHPAHGKQRRIFTQIRDLDPSARGGFALVSEEVKVRVGPFFRVTSVSESPGASPAWWIESARVPFEKALLPLPALKTGAASSEHGSGALPGPAAPMENADGGITGGIRKSEISLPEWVASKAGGRQISQTQSNRNMEFRVLDPLAQPSRSMSTGTRERSEGARRERKMSSQGNAPRLDSIPKGPSAGDSSGMGPFSPAKRRSGSVEGSQVSDSATRGQPRRTGLASIREDLPSVERSAEHSGREGRLDREGAGDLLMERIPLREVSERSAARIWRIVNSHAPIFLSERVCIGQGNFLNEVRMCTTLFIGLPGLEEAMQRADISDDEALRMVEVNFATIFTAIERHEGYVLQLRCDEKGFVCICAFGLPGRSHSDDSLRGVRAAVDIRNKLREHSFEAVIGIGCGKLLCATVGAPGIRTEYTVFGNAINLSARLMVQGRRGLGSLICDDVTCRATRNGATLRPLDALTVKGRSEPIPVYEVLDAQDPSTALDYHATVGLMGRDPELALLNDLTTRFVATDIGHSVIIEGVQGMGKSAVLAYMRNKVGAEDLLVLHGKETKRKGPFTMWTGIFQAVFSHPSIISRDETGLRFMKKLAALIPNYTEVIASVAWTLGLPKRLLATFGVAMGRQRSEKHAERRSGRDDAESVASHRLQQRRPSVISLRHPSRRATSSRVAPEDDLGLTVAQRALSKRSNVAFDAPGDMLPRGRRDMGHATSLGERKKGSSGMRNSDALGGSVMPLVSSRNRPGSVTMPRSGAAARAVLNYDSGMESRPAGQAGWSGGEQTENEGGDGARRATYAGAMTMDEDQMIDVLVKILRVTTTLGKPVILLDDMHRADRASWMLLRKVCLGLESVCVVVTVDPSQQAPPYARTAFSDILAGDRTQRVILDSLSPEQVEQLIHAVCGPRSLPAEMHELIFERTQGHPLLTEQLLGYLSQMDPPDQRRAFADLGSIVDDELPLTSVITNRIDALRPSEQLTLKVTSILGANFNMQLLRAVHPIRASADVVMRDVDSLVENKFLAWADHGTRDQLVFVTNIIREVAYAMVPATQRAKVHHAAAKELLAVRDRDAYKEQLKATGYGAEGADLERASAAAIADHLTRSLGFVDRTIGFRVRQAVQLWEEAANTALDHGADTDALQYLERAEETAFKASEVHLEELGPHWEADKDGYGSDKQSMTAPTDEVFEVSPSREALWSRIAAKAYLGLHDPEAAVEALVMGVGVLGINLAAKGPGLVAQMVACCRPNSSLRLRYRADMGTAPMEGKTFSDVLTACELLVDAAEMVASDEVDDVLYKIEALVNCVIRHHQTVVKGVMMLDRATRILGDVHYLQAEQHDVENPDSDSPPDDAKRGVGIIEAEWDQWGKINMETGNPRMW